MNDYWLAVLLGVVEGLTEFLPVSSTGHLLIAEQCLGIELEEGFWKVFTVVIQLGAILAVVVYYARRLRDLVRDFLRPASARPRWRHPLVLVLAAVIPAGLVGVLLKKRIEELMEDARPIAAALIVGAVAIALIERLCRGRGRVTDVADTTPGQALGIGLAQVFALIPGMSRSACTIMGGRVCGLNLRAAADFSFLLGIPTMTAAAGYSLLKAPLVLDAHQWGVLALGFATAFVVALAVVAWFLSYLKSHDFGLFVAYRIVLGLAILAAWQRGWLRRPDSPPSPQRGEGSMKGVPCNSAS